MALEGQYNNVLLQQRRMQESYIAGVGERKNYSSDGFMLV